MDKKGSFVTGAVGVLAVLLIISFIFGGLYLFGVIPQSWFAKEVVEGPAGETQIITGLVAGKTATANFYVQDYASKSPTQVAVTSGLYVWEMSKDQKDSKTAFGTTGAKIKSAQTTSATAMTAVGSETGKYLDAIVFTNGTGNYYGVPTENIQVTETPNIEVKAYRGMAGCPEVKLVYNGQFYTPGTTACTNDTGAGGGASCGGQPNLTAVANGYNSFDYIRIKNNETSRVKNLGGIIWNMLSQDTNVQQVDISTSLGVERSNIATTLGVGSSTPSIVKTSEGLNRLKGSDWLFKIQPNTMLFEGDIFKTGELKLTAGGTSPANDTQLFYLVNANGFLDKTGHYGYGLQDDGNNPTITGGPDCGYGFNFGGV